jgi:DNA-binding LacI/PurR family transcriptional regulator
MSGPTASPQNQRRSFGAIRPPGSCNQKRFRNQKRPNNQDGPYNLIGIRELARHLQISIGTVSRALNDRADVNPLTRQRVRDAAAKLGYSPNQSGRSLRRGRTDLIAMIVPSGPDEMLINSVFLSVLDGLKRRLGERQLDLAIFLEERGEDRLTALRRVTQRGLADALIIANTQSLDPRVDYLTKLGKPFVTFGRTKNPARHAWVDPDFESAAANAVAYLATLGHRRIALMLPDRHINYLDLLEAGYCRAMRANGLIVDESWRRRRPMSERGGLETAEALLSADPRPTAILVSDSLQTVALHRGLAEAGLRAGRDISILGLLTEARAQYLSPALTTYQTDWTEIGVRLGDAVMFEIAQVAAGPLQPAPEKALLIGKRLQFKMPIVFSAGDSVCRIELAADA